MKLHGKKPSRPKPEIVVIPRDEGDLVFVCNAVLDYSKFEEICPDPKPRISVNAKTGAKTSLFEEPQFIEAVKKHNQRHTDFTIVESLKDTPGLEWEKVVYDDPETWSFLSEELRDSGLTIAEAGVIIQGVFKANTVNEDRMEEARASFIRSQAEQPAT